MTVRIAVFCSLLIAGGCHPWFRSDFSRKEKPDLPPVLMSPDGNPYEVGNPRWVLLIHECMASGGELSGCIDGLPEQEYEKFLAWEQRYQRR